MPIVGIHARFEQFPTSYASCDMHNHLSAFLDRVNSIKCKNLSKTKTTWHGVLN